jgi:hypothetical protein
MPRHAHPANRLAFWFATFWLLIALAALPLTAHAQPPIEAAYAAPGPLAVARQTVNDAQGRKLYEVFAPAPLRGGHPVITWGNGTGAVPGSYAPLLSHLASWGFVVIDNYKRNTGTGEAILGAAQYMVAQNADSTSPLFQQLDVSRIGAAGHSQGASGVINAATNWPDSALIRTVVPIALPTQTFTQPDDRYDTSQLTVPMFLIGGTDDFLISPTSTNNTAYRRTDDALPAAMAMKKNAGHSEITPDGGSQRGYLTAWLMFQLRDDPRAAAAFSGTDAELLGNNGWKNAKTQNLP